MRTGKMLGLTTRFIDILVIWMGCFVAHQIVGMDWTFKSSVLFMLAMFSSQFFGEVFGLYLPLRNRSVGVSVWRITLVMALTFLVLIAAAWVSREPHYVSRRMLYAWWMLYSGVALIGIRIFVRFTLFYLRNKGYNIKRAAIVGDGDLALKLSRKFQENLWMGIFLHGFYAEKSNIFPSNLYRGGFEDVVNAAKNGDVDQVYIALPMSEEEKIKSLVDELMDTTVSIILIPDMFAFNLMNARQDNIGGLPAISLVDSPLSAAGNIAKRALDLLVSIFILFLIAVPMLVIAVAIKLTSSGPVIFRQGRYGIDGKPIVVWKFRTMNVLENDDVVVQAKRHDNRLTPIGSFLRRTSLDELPQFINVLQGSMSVVGPRPHAIAHNELYRKQIKGYMQRHKVKPGITGWAQVNGFRGETDTLEKMERRIDFDLYYICHWSIFFDIKIIFMTIFSGFTGKNAF